jgi:hypothetical protein
VLDGSNHNDPYNNLNLPLPFPDAMQEFKVETSALPAQYGHHAAAAINAVTKAGTNVLHGGGFGFLRHHRMNAKGTRSPRSMASARATACGAISSAARWADRSSPGNSSTSAGIRA